MERSDSVLKYVIPPKSDTDLLECFNEGQGAFTDFLGQHHNGLMRKKTISQCLTHGFTPIGHLAFKRSGSDGSSLKKMVHIVEQLRRCVPTNRKDVCNAISTHRNLARYGYFRMLRSAVQSMKARHVCARKGDRESILRSCHTFASRKIVAGLTEFQFADYY